MFVAVFKHSISLNTVELHFALVYDVQFQKIFIYTPLFGEVSSLRVVVVSLHEYMYVVWFIHYRYML